MSRLARRFRSDLVEAMVAAGVTRSDLARRMKVSPQRITKFLSHGEPGLVTVERAARALGLVAEVRLSKIK